MPDLLFDIQDDTATITLNRPEARNAYSEEMVTQLLDCLEAADLDDRVRVLIITGTGSTFSAGGDLKAMRDKTGMFAGDPVELRKRYERGLQRITRRFDSLDKPVVAAINGHAVGAGLDLTLMCDIRIASAHARFGSTFARVGLIPGDGGAYLLRRAVGFARAVELILTARIIDATEALQIGLVHRVVEADSVLASAHKTAARIASLPPKAVQASKAALYRTVDRDLETSLQLTAALQAGVQHTDEHLDAVNAMLEQLASK